jgi:hypothetical protein
LPGGVRTRPRLSCLRISPADNNDAVDVIASRLRHLHYLQQGVLRATLTIFEAGSVGTPRRRGPKPQALKAPSPATKLLATAASPPPPRLRVSA